MPQALTTVKSPLVICAAISVSGRSPELTSEICCAALDVVICCAAKVSEGGESASVAGEVPMPIREAVWVPASSTMVKLPLRVPETVGVNATDTVQPTLGPRLAPHVFAANLKSPVREDVCNPRGEVPVFEIVMFRKGLVALITVEAKLTAIGLSTIAAAALASPESDAVL